MPRIICEKKFEDATVRAVDIERNLSFRKIVLEYSKTTDAMGTRIWDRLAEFELDHAEKPTAHYNYRDRLLISYLLEDAKQLTLAPNETL